jgi:hypothetical protein
MSPRRVIKPGRCARPSSSHFTTPLQASFKNLYHLPQKNLMDANLTSLHGLALAEYINSQLKGGSNYANPSVSTQGESIDIYKFRFDEFSLQNRLINLLHIRSPP